MSNKTEWDDKQIAIGTILIFIGAMMILSLFGFLIDMLGRSFSIGTLYVIEFCILGAAILLTGIFSIIKWRTKAGIIILGLGSTILGGFLVIITLMIIIRGVNIMEPSSLIFIFEYEMPILISGMVLFLHGQILMIKKQKNMKLVWYVFFSSVGLTVITYLVLASATSIPLFDPFLALYLELFITIPIISYFCIEKVKNERTKLLRGVISILAGGFILIISIISVIKLNIIMNFFVALIILPLGLIFYGIFVIIIVIFSNNLKS